MVMSCVLRGGQGRKIGEAAHERDHQIQRMGALDCHQVDAGGRIFGIGLSRLRLRTKPDRRRVCPHRQRPPDRARGNQVRGPADRRVAAGLQADGGVDSSLPLSGSKLLALGHVHPQRVLGIDVLASRQGLADQGMVRGQRGRDGDHVDIGIPDQGGG